MMRLGCVAAVFACVAGAAPAWAQMESREGIALQNQILELRRDMQALRNDPGRGPAPYNGSLGNTGRSSNSAGSGEATAQLLDRVDRLEDLVRRLNGRLDEAENARQRQGADLSKQLGDLQYRVENSGGTAAPSRPATPPPVTGSQAPVPLGTVPATPAGPPKRTPELALQEGNAALARRDYAAAETSAREVLAGSKTSPRGYDAQFLLAQSLMGARNYPQAAVGYGDTYDRNKTGQHAQDSLIGLASSLSAINEKRSACAALDTLRTQFAAPRAEIATRATALRATAGCR